jgi:hypothetical protein
MSSSSSSASLLPPFGALLRAVWSAFRARFWRLVVLTVLFSLANLLLQMSFFGAVAWGSFVDSLSGGGGTSFGVMPLFVSLSGASLWVMVPVILLTLVLQIWYHASLVVVVQEGGMRIGAVMRRGAALFLRVAAQLAALFLAVRLAYFLLALAAGLIFRYLGLVGGSVELVNRLLLLVFALALMVAGIMTGFSLLRTLDGVRNPLQALKEGAQIFWREPWGVLWRVVVMLLIAYIINELAAQIQLRGLPVQWQALLSLFYIPFLLLFLSHCYKPLITRP